MSSPLLMSSPSKTMSLNLVLSQLQGRFSSSKLLQGLPGVQTFHLQLSERSVAKNVTDLKRTVVEWKSDKSIPCIFMEELSMADASPKGPLRALHDLLDAHQDTQGESGGGAASRRVGTGANSFAFLATSNYRAGSMELPIGRALGNRMLVLAHQPLADDDLVDLAVRVGLNRVPTATGSAPDRTSLQSALERSVRPICSQGLVPEVVSIRSILYYSQFLALRFAQVSGDLIDETDAQIKSAQADAFFAHLQPLGSSEVWHMVRQAQGLGQVATTPTVKAIVQDAFSVCRTRRPLLFQYEHPADIQHVVDLVCRTFQVVGGRRPDPLLLCPGAQAMSPGESTAECLHAMLQLKTKVERGDLIFILNPEPIVEGIHALLNDCAEEHSTVQLRGAYEAVNLHQTTQMILLVEKKASLSLHRALVSRVAVVNAGPIGWGDHALARPCVLPEGPAFISHHCKLHRLYQERPSVLTDAWLGEERALLEEMENPLDELISSLVPRPDSQSSTHGTANGRLVIIGIAGSLPLSVQRKPILLIDAQTLGTVSDILAAIKKKVERLEALDDWEVDRRDGQSATLVLDLSSASSVRVVEVLTLLGFAGQEFTSAASPDNVGAHGGAGPGDSHNKLRFRLARLASRLDRRVCIVVDVSTAHCCMPGHFRSWRKTSAGAPKAPWMRSLVSYVEVREMSRSYPAWSPLAVLAQDPKLAWQHSVDLVVDGITPPVPEDTDGAKKWRRKLAEVALTYFVPEEECKGLLCPHVGGQDFGETLAAPDLQDRRVTRFQALLASVLNKSSRAQSLRQAFIEGCRDSASRVAAMLVQRIHPQLVLSPSEELVSFITRALASRVFPWCQQPAVPRQLAVERQDTFPFLSDILGLLRKRGGQNLTGARLWHSLDSAALSATLNDALPTLTGFTLSPALTRALAGALIQSLNECGTRAGNEIQGMRMTGGSFATDVLVKISANTVVDVLENFVAFESWLVVAAHLGLSYRDQLSAPTEELPSTPGALLPFLCDRVRESLGPDHCLAGSCHDRGNFLQYASHIQIAIGESSKWGYAMPSIVVEIKMLLSLSFLMNSLSSLSLATREMLEVANSVLQDGTLAARLFPKQPDASEMTLIRSVLEGMDETRGLPDLTISTAVERLGLTGRGHELLASCALRRPAAQDALSLVHAFLENAFKGHEGAGSDTAPASNPATLLASEALRDVSASRKGFVDAALEFFSKKEPAEGHAWHALRLAAAAFIIPDLVFNRIEMIVEPALKPEPQASSRAAKKARQRKHHIAKFLAGSAAGSLEIRNLLVRCLISRYDERGLATCGVSEHVVGSWIQPFLAAVEYEDLEGLCAVPGFDGSCDCGVAWPRALARTLVGDGSDVCEDEDFGSHLRVVLVDTDLAFCRLACAIWCVQLLALQYAGTGNALACSSFINDNLDALFCPGAPEGAHEMLRRLGQRMGFRTLNRCRCGELYAIGECGRPSQVSRCAACGENIGGEDHVWLAGNEGVDVFEQAGNRHVVGIRERMDNDAVRGISLDWFVGGVGYCERDMSPLEYRLLSVLLLIPLAVLSESPRRPDRLAQLRRHWDAFKEVSGTASDTDAQHLILGLLVRANQAGTAADLAMAGFDFQQLEARAGAEAAFCKGVRAALGADDVKSVLKEVQDRIKHVEDSRQGGW